MIHRNSTLRFSRTPGFVRYFLILSILVALIAPMNFVLITPGPATSLFPKGEEPPQEEEVYPEILRPATERAPNIIDEGTNYVMDEPGIEVIQFHHRRADGSEYNHEHSMISADTLQGFIKAHEHIYEENFGYCYDKACGARLYPEEIKRFVNPKVYEVYRRLFNEKFKAPKKTGGARMNIFADAEAECVPVKKPAKGGKTKKQRFILKTRKNKQQNKNNSRKR